MANAGTATIPQSFYETVGPGQFHSHVVSAFSAARDVSRPIDLETGGTP
jgi:hypothetical protein